MGDANQLVQTIWVKENTSLPCLLEVLDIPGPIDFYWSDIARPGSPAPS